MSMTDNLLSYLCVMTKTVRSIIINCLEKTM